MKVSDEQLEAMCEAYGAYPGGLVDSMRAALAVLPEPVVVDEAASQKAEKQLKAAYSALAQQRAERDAFLKKVGYDALCEVELDFLEWTQMKRERDDALAKVAALRGESQHYQAELNECQDAFEKAWKERDEARALLAEERKHLLADEERRKLTGDALQAESDLAAANERIAKLEAAVEAERKALRLTESYLDEARAETDDHRRQRDEARAELAETQAVIDGLHAQLAARPEPVVVDDALIARKPDPRELVRQTYGQAAFRRTWSHLEIVDLLERLGLV